ncbi:HD-GYP domain, c-di-GMP phosphodiesterase class II (or its inactivated variant) [Clostridium cavendishii DSM 21758]|uniref:HD-GYP domain, c-di-GMP phosphodiesterase class II (Or its inactivated variant) n=1 Tax=Clostridium cavendishii DSM 21758 TaxID=1121302 RepID=A0A1M6PK87_9CLOT|nr:HD-GYP domain-containing protein [Clostridium cavendishii]SHK08328.1 HD-GYP domain, c-di-GMP phosphodiesterase class II (or its inactivated variant) [Clostridium cavendishii DSM 21758]
MRLVPIECAREGCYLAKTIFDEDGRTLLREGVKLTASLLKRIKDIHIYSLYIVDEYSEHEIEDVIKPELRQKSINLVKSTFCNAEKLYFKQDNSSPKKSYSALIREKEEYLTSIYDLAEELLNNIMSNKNIMVNLVDIKSMDNYTYQHCTNVAILSLVLGIGLNLPKQDLLDLCIGALLHDIGKVFIDKSLLSKSGPFTDEEYETMKKHPELGYNHLKKISNLSTNSRIIVLQHHERIDGTGYPDGRADNRINRLAKIVSVADVYDALTSDRPYKRALSPNEAFEYILGNADTSFDYNIVKAFANIIVPYPKGTLVKLSTGDIGIVEKTPSNYPLRPTVKILKSEKHSSIGTLVDLVKELSIVISSIQYEL